MDRADHTFSEIISDLQECSKSPEITMSMHRYHDGVSGEYKTISVHSNGLTFKQGEELQNEVHVEIPPDTPVTVMTMGGETVFDFQINGGRLFIHTNR